MKQISIGTIQYVQDHDELFPPSGGSTGWCGTNAYHKVSWAEAAQPYIKSTQVFKCPSDSMSSSGVSRAAATASYGNNRALGPLWMAVGDVTTTRAVNIAVVQQTAKVVMWYEDESSALQTIECNDNATDPNNNQLAYNRHFDGVNHSFVDGHVKWFKVRKTPSPADTPAGISYDPAYAG